MHLKNRPVYFVKNGTRKPVYYSVDARQLIDQGWAEEGGEPSEPVRVTGVPIPITKPEPATVTLVQPEQAQEKKEAAEVDSMEPALPYMTKAELIDYARKNNIEVDQYSVKAAILKTIRDAESD